MTGIKYRVFLVYCTMGLHGWENRLMPLSLSSKWIKRRTKFPLNVLWTASETLGDLLSMMTSRSFRDSRRTSHEQLRFKMSRKVLRFSTSHIDYYDPRLHVISYHSRCDGICYNPRRHVNWYAPWCYMNYYRHVTWTVPIQDVKFSGTIADTSCHVNEHYAITI